MPVVLVLLLAVAWLAAMWLGFVVVFRVLFPLVLVAATVAALGLYYMYAWRTLVPGTSDGPSPVPRPEVSYRHYLLRQVWHDWWSIARTAGPHIYRTARQALEQTTRLLLTGGRWGFFTFPLWLAICAGVVTAAIPAAALAVALTLLYGVVAAAGLAGWLLCVLVLAAVERLFMAYGRILQTCPHPFCYQKIALPVYACPGCGLRHRRLTPSTAGAFRHVCRCGARLPTTIPLGRFRLTAYCPHCDGRLPARIGRVRVEPLPFVGGPAAGKTTFMFLAVRALHARAGAMRGSLAFVEKGHAQAYAAAVQEFERGGRLAKTGPELPLATMVDVELPRAGHRILYLFDPAGEHFTGATQVESLRYLDHGETLLLVVDPFALPQVRRALTDDEQYAVDEGAASSEEDPADTLQRVLNELRSRPDRGRQKRVAVVVTKIDLLSRTAVGNELAGRADDSAAVRAWLDRLGLGNTLRTLDQLSAQVRCFGSGLGTEPAAVAGLVGWVTGLTVDDDAPGLPAEAGSAAPGTAPLRDPWPVRGRGADHVPASYRAGRWAVLAGLFLLGVAALAITAGWAVQLLR
ncbi:hypothetical protein DPM19_29475 [Actinomadura craniellae]|uniref:Double-GTPase 2 domain-containing protein n=1 Tax=Actinomadura craniellae TaxID=2231787 RepID=A0A365H0L8_9ACTN|nr:hypothetical protein [Actinomadura craniellae]RAY11743.1 hypothetical protein DPM19_29475 [Actinomadura craniellae]